MTDQPSEKEYTERRALLEAEMEAEKRAHARSNGGALWGAWEPSRLFCRTCKADVVNSEDRAAFLDSEETFEQDTLIARANIAFDLRHRKRIDIPAWVNTGSELWKSKHNTWAEYELDEILLRATAVDALGTYGKYSRACDSASHVFIRACNNCNESDPLNILPELARSGMERVLPPHTFLDALFEDQESRQKRNRRLEEHLRQWALNPDKKIEDIASQIADSAPKQSDGVAQPVAIPCRRCGLNRNPDDMFCSQCGSR